MLKVSTQRNVNTCASAHTCIYFAHLDSLGRRWLDGARGGEMIGNTTVYLKDSGQPCPNGTGLPR
jgi:hypothetical protein